MATVTDGSTWTPPPAEWLTFSNCTTAAPWLAKFSSLYQNGDLSWTGVSFDLAINYLRSMVPSNWTEPTDMDLLMWYKARTDGLEVDGTVFQAMIDFPMESCGKELCYNLSWQGDPDLAGVGVSCSRYPIDKPTRSLTIYQAMLSYYILTVFATLYFAVLFWDSLTQATHRSQGLRQRRRTLAFVMTGFQKSVDCFQE